MVSVGVKVAVMREFPAEPSVTVPPETVAIDVVAELKVNVPGIEGVIVGNVKVKDASPTNLEGTVKFERLGVAFSIVNDWTSWDAAS